LLSPYAQNIVQILFALFMALWVMWFNIHYKRYEKRLQTRWGYAHSSEDIVVRDEFIPNCTGSWRVSLIKLMGHILGMCVVGLVMAGTWWLHLFRKYLEDEGAHWLWIRLAALLMTVQILTLDGTWYVIVRWVVNHENHQTQSQWNDSCVHKLFFVRIFSNLFPFLFISLQQHLPGVNCPEQNCLEELEPALMVYFVSRVTGRFICNLALVVYENSQIFAELKQLKSQFRSYTYVEIQSKCLDYGPERQMDDWTDMILTFAFLSCFNVVVPAIAPVALVTSIIHIRCMAYRNLHSLKRPIPREAPGIGGFQALLDHIEVMAVIVNVGLAIFSLSPLRELPMTIKWLLFCGMQYFLSLMKILMIGEYPIYSADVTSCRSVNKDMLHRLLHSGKVTQEIVAEQVTKLLPNVGPRAFK